MKKTLRMLVVLLCCLLLSACAASNAPSAAGIAQNDEKILSDVRTQYRNASLIVEGVCTNIHTNAAGATCYDMEISDVLAGTANVGDTIECTKGSMTLGETYVLFLQEGEDTPYAEDTSGFALLSDTPLPVTNEEIIWDNKRLPVSVMKDEIQELNEIISAPTPVLYYDTLAALVEAADEIFIGQVAELPPLSEQQFYFKNGGAAQKTQYAASEATIRVLGSIKGALGQYGETIRVIYCPERITGMLSASTLQPMSFTVGDVTTLHEGGIYLFFFIEGPDSKQPCYFPLNHLQGYVQIQEDELLVNELNKPVVPYETLTNLVQTMHTILNWVQPGTEEVPPLVVD